MGRTSPTPGFILSDPVLSWLGQLPSWFHRCSGSWLPAYFESGIPSHGSSAFPAIEGIFISGCRLQAGLLP